MPKTSKKIGSKYGRLTILCSFPFQKRTAYKCLCDCGTTVTVQAANIISRTTISCGCFQKEQVAKRSSKFPGEAIKKSIWHYYRRNAKTRNILWHLTFEEFLSFILSPCYYCGIVGGTITKQRGNVMAHNGVDRFYSNQEYNKENCVACCKRCNMAKSNMHPKEFEEWVQSVYSHLFEGNQ